MNINFKDNLNRVDNSIIDGLIHALYCDSGQDAVFELAHKLDNSSHSIDWEYCEACEWEAPTWSDEHTCWVCGSVTKVEEVA